MSVTPKIIETPLISAVAIDGIEVKVIAKVTVSEFEQTGRRRRRRNDYCQSWRGIVTTVGSSQSHKSVLENPI